MSLPALSCDFVRNLCRWEFPLHGNAVLLPSPMRVGLVAAEPLPFLHPLLPFPCAVSSSLSPESSFVASLSSPPTGFPLSYSAQLGRVGGSRWGWVLRIKFRDTHLPRFCRFAVFYYRPTFSPSPLEGQTPAPQPIRFDCVAVKRGAGGETVRSDISCPRASSFSVRTDWHCVGGRHAVMCAM